MATQKNKSMVSETSICNQALTWLGQDPISTLAEGSTTAEWMRNNYPFIRDAVLEERNWTFATARAVNVTEDRDAWDNMFVHAIPLNWLAVYRVYRRVATNGQQTADNSHRVEGNKILSRESTIYLWGLEQVSDTGRFSNLFIQALAARLAADAAIPLTENRQLQIDMWALYGDKLREAAARDGQQGANDVITDRILVNSRYSDGFTILGGGG